MPKASVHSRIGTPCSNSRFVNALPHWPPSRSSRLDWWDLSGPGASSRPTGRRSELIDMSDALTTHMIGDMMHDALHSDVLAALLSFSQGTNESDYEETRRSFDEHAETFRTALRTNAARTTLDQEIKAALDGAEPALNRYIGAADTIIGLTRANGVEAQVRMPEFIEAFEALEIQNEEISTLIERRKAERATRNDNTSSLALTLGIAVTLVGLIVTILLSAVTARSITRPLARAADAIRKISEGSRDIVLEPGANDEIGEVSRAIMTMQSQAADLDDMRKADIERRQAAERRAAQSASATGRFNESIAGIVDALIEADRDLRTVAGGMSAQASTASRQAMAVQSAAGQTASAVAERRFRRRGVVRFRDRGRAAHHRGRRGDQRSRRAHRRDGRTASAIWRMRRRRSAMSST